MAVTIPPDIRATIDAFYRQQLRDRFGDMDPSPEEEVGFIDAWKAKGLMTVPLPDGTELTRPSVAVAGDYEPAPLPTGQAASSSPARKWVGGGLLAAVALAAVWLLWPAGDTGKSPGSGPAELATLPADIDALVSAGGVKGGAVVPRTLEIVPNNSLTTTTFVVVPVNVKKADWPCPVRKFDDQPAACWVVGTITNYLIGIPYGPETESLAAELDGRGGRLRLRLSTEKVLEFEAHVIEVERHQVEALAQKALGLTVPLLYGAGNRRTLIVGVYDESADVVGGADVGRRPATPVSVSVALGQSARLGRLEVRAVGRRTGGKGDRLTLEVGNLGATLLVAGRDWQVLALDAAGAARPAQVEGEVRLPAGETGLMSWRAPGPVAAWQVTAAGYEALIVP